MFGTVSKVSVFIRKTFISKKQSTSKLFCSVHWSIPHTVHTCKDAACRQVLGLITGGSAIMLINKSCDTNLNDL